MREIKFRAWDGNGARMLDNVNTINGKAAINKPCNDDRVMEDKHGVNYYANWDFDVPVDYPIMQFTGLKDVNGVDIYECMEIDGVYEVKFIKGSYVLIDISSGDTILLYNYVNSRGGNVKITREYTKV